MRLTHLNISQTAFLLVYGAYKPTLGWFATYGRDHRPLARITRLSRFSYHWRVGNTHGRTGTLKAAKDAVFRARKYPESFRKADIIDRRPVQPPIDIYDETAIYPRHLFGLDGIIDSIKDSIDMFKDTRYPRIIEHE